MGVPPQERMLVEYEDAAVLVTDQKIETIKEILPVLEAVTRKQPSSVPLLIVAEDVTGVLQWCPTLPGPPALPEQLGQGV